MWEKYTERARRAIHTAQKTAERCGDSIVGIDHLLMGILTHEDTVAAAVLNGIDCPPGLMHDDLEDLLVKKLLKSKEPMTLGACAKTAIDHAHAESQRQQHFWIGTEHLLLGVVLAEVEPTRKLLDAYGVTADAVRAALAELPSSATYFEAASSRSNPTHEINAAHGLSWQAFTANTREAVLQAQREAARLGGNIVWPEHLLLGLLRAETSVARTLLLALQVTPEELTATLAPIVSRGPAHDAEREMQLHPKALAVLEEARKAAERDRRKWIGAEHLLLATIAIGGEPAASVFHMHGIDTDRARTALANLYPAYTRPAAPTAKASKSQSATRPTAPAEDNVQGPVRLRTREEPDRKATPRRLNVLTVVILLLLLAAILRYLL